MSDSGALLQRRIRNASDLQSVVRTMKSIAASKIIQCEQSVSALAEYSRSIDLGVGAFLRAAEPHSGPSEGKRHQKYGRICAVVFGSDQGLVGQFNDVVADCAIQGLSPLSGIHAVIAIGDRIRDHIANAGVEMVGKLIIPSSIEGVASLIGEILVQIGALYSHNGNDQIYIVHNRQIPGSQYAPVFKRLLPLDRSWGRDAIAIPWPTPIPPELVNSGETMLPALIDEYLFISLFRACAESMASENASRLSAMERADRNIDEMLVDYQSQYHRLRQDGIDEELFDVIFGFEAIGGQG
jgi:F-type H+-transporting ATPase subunit gamma